MSAARSRFVSWQIENRISSRSPAQRMRRAICWKPRISSNASSFPRLCVADAKASSKPVARIRSAGHRFSEISKFRSKTPMDPELTGTKIPTPSKRLTCVGDDMSFSIRANGAGTSDRSSACFQSSPERSRTLALPPSAKVAKLVAATVLTTSSPINAASAMAINA